MVSAVGIAPGGKEELPKLSCLGLRERIAWLEATEKAGVLRESERPYARFWVSAGVVRKMR